MEKKVQSSFSSKMQNSPLTSGSSESKFDGVIETAPRKPSYYHHNQNLIHQNNHHYRIRHDPQMLWCCFGFYCYYYLPIFKTLFSLALFLCYAVNCRKYSKHYLFFSSCISYEKKIILTELKFFFQEYERYLAIFFTTTAIEQISCILFSTTAGGQISCILFSTTAGGQISCHFFSTTAEERISCNFFPKTAVEQIFCNFFFYYCSRKDIL